MTKDYPAPRVGASAAASAQTIRHRRDRCRRLLELLGRHVDREDLHYFIDLTGSVLRRNWHPVVPWDMTAVEEEARGWALLSPEAVLAPYAWFGHLGLPEGRRGRFLAAGISALPEEIRVVTLDRLRGGAA